MPGERPRDNEFLLPRLAAGFCLGGRCTSCVWVAVSGIIVTVAIVIVMIGRTPPRLLVRLL